MNEQQTEIRVFPAAADVALAARDLVLSIVSNAESNRPVHLVLAGGSTPVKLYELLVQDDTVSWANVHFWFGDERTVPPDHDDSNFGMAHSTLLSNLEVPSGNVHRMRGEDPPEAAAAAYQAEIEREVPLDPSGMPQFDLVLLGLGDDGHTASLFPGTEALAESERIVVANVVPQQNTVRITLTDVALNAASNVLFIVTGAAKANALASVIEDGDSAPPASLVNPVHGKLSWYVDEAAAANLSSDQVSR
jgi:6-phosphogluconolactonase